MANSNSQVSIMQRLGGAATQAGSTMAGTVMAGFARKKIPFLDTTIGKLLLIVIGLLIISYSKSETMKGLGTGIAAGGALGFAGSIGLAGIDGLGTVGDVGALVQDENGMVYMTSGVGDEYMPYNLPIVSGLTQTYGTDGLSGGVDMSRI